MMKRIRTFLLPAALFAAVIANSQTLNGKYDLNTDPVLYTVGYAHLDTQWRWDYPETINDYIRATMDDNFRYFEKYKGYVFTFSGARRYRMMKEYYPARYEKLKKYIGLGRWNVGGSSVDECDANIPSPESLIRQVLYGNQYFRNEFGKESIDFLLPDCFGFQAHVPSVLAYCGLSGFSTQKLEWGSAVGIPFNVGNWTGPDGKGVVAALNATDYGGDIEFRLDTVKYWVDRVMDNGKKYGVYADYRYYGTGDIGGAPSETAIKNGLGSLNNPDSRIHVYLCSSDQLFRVLTPDQRSRLPVYSGDLLLTQHSAGSLSSEAYMKRWNRKNELLAQQAEPLAAAADWLGGEKYPFRTLHEAWWLVLGSQMHDILPGTCIPKAYEYAWNDEVLGLNQFAGCLEDAAGVIIRAMDTRVAGKAVVVYNPVAAEREGIAEAEISYPEGVPEYVRVYSPDGKEVPVQELSRTKTSVRIIFVAKVPSFGLTCFDVQGSKQAGEFSTGLITGKNTLMNNFYQVTLNANGDVTSIYDKTLNKELLSGPARMVFQKEHPEYWPAWNMDWKDRKMPPIGFVDQQPKITLAENGPVRIAFKVERQGRNSTFVQYIRLAAGEQGKRVEFANTVQWQSKGVSLKASFPLTASNVNATYNLGLGTIERSTNNEKKYEVPSREWFDLTDKSGNFGVTLLEDCKFGSDKPDDKTLRLTLLYTPTTNFYHDQATQDWGTHEFTYALYGHKGDWRTGRSEWQGRYLNQPLIAFQARSHSGSLGKTFSFVKVNTLQADIRAVKKTEDGKGILVRVQELFGQDADPVEISMPVKIVSATEVDGQERELGPATVTNGKLVTNLTKFQLRSFVLHPEDPADKLSEPQNTPLALEYDRNVVSSDQDRSRGAFVKGGYSYPAELFPEELTVNGVKFTMGKTTPGKNNVVTCTGQKIPLPKTGFYNKVYILAAAENDTTAVFRLGELKKTIRVESYTGKIGQFDKRIWDKLGRVKDLEPGFIKRDRVAWFVPHMHKDSLNMPYQYGYVYLYSMEVSPSAGFLQLPYNDAIRIFAITVSDNPNDQAQPLKPLYDDFTGRKSFPLVLEKRYVSEDMAPMAKLTVTRKKTLNDLPYRISMKDYADLHMPNGVTMKYYYSGTETIKGKMPEEGMVMSAMIDGMFDLLPADSVKDVWFENGEGRIVMDLQRPTGIDSLHMFSQVDPVHGPQFFSVWYSDKDKMPSVEGDPKAAGWKYMVSATPLDVWGSGKVVYSMVPDKAKPQQYRWMMWVTESTDHGPYYFREVDVFER
ncbi:MAG TPA: glycoside hydrolase family 38 C-terminal domain-containing protein [Bacteroidales bacterium]|nr:glycoside hydrolase family 38 C-terminal domain-containing protein [Bacteroidales bacterium]